MTDARNIRTGMDGILPPEKIADDESCYAISDLTRQAAIKLLSALSRNHLVAFGLRDDEISAVEWLYEVLETT